MECEERVEANRRGLEGGIEDKALNDSGDRRRGSTPVLESHSPCLTLVVDGSGDTFFFEEEAPAVGCQGVLVVSRDGPTTLWKRTCSTCTNN